MVNIKEYVNNIYEELLIDLNTVAKIHVGQKINTQGKYIQIDKTSIFQGVVRYLHGDDRAKTYHKLSYVMHQSALALGTMVQSIKLHPHTTDSYESFNILSDKLTAAVDGLHNLSVTYADDVNMYTSITKLANTIFSIVEQYKKIVNESLSVE